VIFKRIIEMAKTFRFTDEEEQALNEVALKINRDLVKAGKKPLRDTEIFHEIIKQTLVNGSVEVSRDGSLKVETKK
jgi:site-specific DNA-adenine methylase